MGPPEVLQEHPTGQVELLRQRRVREDPQLQRPPRHRGLVQSHVHHVLVIVSLLLSFPMAYQTNRIYYVLPSMII